MPSLKSVLYCHCAHARVLPAAVKERALRSLCESAFPFVATADLCGLAAQQQFRLQELAARKSLQILACYPRAVQWLFTAAQAPLRPDSVEVVNLRVESAEKAAAAVTASELQSNVMGKVRGETPRPPAGEDACATLQVVLYEGSGAAKLAGDERFALLSALLEKGYTVTCARNESEMGSAEGLPALVLGRFLAGAEKSISTKNLRVQELSGLDAAQVVNMVETRRAELGVAAQGAWMPWFPVIDYDRCTHCMQCLSFCLFGVFGVDGQKRIAVQQSEQCKTNCPACSRVCPEAAIVFPKYAGGPINGEAINSAALEREKMKIDVSALLGGDIYQLLRDRSERAHSRFSKERDSQKALQERQRCVAKLLQNADIPPEVLRALPSAEEIKRRAAEAMAKAQAALKPDRA